MKSISKILGILLIAVVALSSCSDEILVEPTKESNSLIKAPAIELIRDFYTSINTSSSRSVSPNDIISAKEVNRISYSLNDAQPTLNARSSEASFDLVTYSFCIGDSEGFAIVLEAESESIVLNFTERLPYNKIDDCPVLKDIIEELPYAARQNLIYDNKASLPSRSGYDEEWYVEDLTNIIPTNSSGTSWSQTWANNRTPICTDKNCDYYTQHMPIGCVGLSTALAIMHARHFTPTMSENKNINFDYIESLDIANQNWVSVASNYMYEVATGCKTVFGCQGSASNIDKAMTYLASQGYDCELEDLTETPLDFKHVHINLRHNLVTLISGFEEYHGTVGHQWLIDGIKYDDGSNPELWHWYHCDFGYIGSTTWSVFYDFNKYNTLAGEIELYYPHRKKAIYINGIN